jgi:hypothetical protein
MADEEQGKSALGSGLLQDFVAQLRGITEGLEGLAGFGDRLPSVPGGLPLPGALSAAQLTSIADAISAQRQSIGALKAQLSSFDEQLAVLERVLGPLAEWSGRWAELEDRLLRMGRGQGPKAQDQPGES